MALFCTIIRKDSLSLLRFPILSHVHIFSCAISSVSHLKYPFSSSSFCFLDFLVFLSVLTLPMLLSAALINLSLLFLMNSLSPCINASMQFSMLVSQFPPFLVSYSLSMSSVRCKALCIIINFLVLWFFCLSSSLVHFKNSPEYLTRRIKFMLQSLILRSFLILLEYSYFFLYICLLDGVCFQNSQVLIMFLLSKCSDAFLI